MNIKSKQRSLFAGLLIGAAGIINSHAANSTFITFSVDMSTNIANSTFTNGVDNVSVHGTFDGWGTGVVLVQEGAGNVYTNTVNDTVDTNGTQVNYKFVIDGNNYENVVDGNNRAAYLPATSGASLVLPTPFWGDAGAGVTNLVYFAVDMSQQIALGIFTPGTSIIEVQGSFQGWADGDTLTNDTSIIVTNQYGLKSTNVYDGYMNSVGSPAAMEQFKYVILGSPDNYENPDALHGLLVNGTTSGHNRFFANVPQALPSVFFSDAPYAPIVSNINFSVDMSIVALTDTNFNPASVTVNGDLMGWGGVQMTNNPAAANTNIYTSISTYDAGVGSGVNYQFRYTELSNGNIVYDHANGANGGQGNRLYTVADVAATNVLSVFNDAVLSAYLAAATPVTFSVDMNGAVGTDNHVFNPSSDNVYVNGQFANWYSWATGINPLAAPPGFQMIEVGTSTIYTNTVVFPAGTPVDCAYKYGMDEGAVNGGPGDNEAGQGDNHIRVVRSLAVSPYVMASDKFGVYQYPEPFFSNINPTQGDLTIGKLSGSTVPVQWLGCPGARLAYSSTLNGPWQQIPATDGSTWSAGINTTNGLESVTNWPTAGGNVYFRLVKPH